MNAGARKQARGFSLVIALVLLVVMSVLGIAVLRSSAMQERMSGNLRDRSLAMQAAETALRFAQDQLAVRAPDDVNPGKEDWDTLVPTEKHCTDLGICPTGHEPVWRAGPVLGAGDDAVPDTPTQYWIEYLGTGPAEPDKCNIVTGSGPPADCFKPIFRITARSRSVGRAEVVLQANVIHKLEML